MSGSDATGYRLDDEQRARVRDCLDKARIALPSREFDGFVRQIEATISLFRSAAPEGTYREAHDAMRTIWRLCRDPEPPVGLLRARARALPKEAIEHVVRRARTVIPRLFPGDTIEEGAFDSRERTAARFLDWVAKAEGAKLITALRVLTGQGATIVAGRSRGNGRRSRPRLEPIILGEIRGAGTRIHRGGAPAANARHDMVMHLALDWYRATGEDRRGGRSDKTGFGDLVHSIFQWLELSEDPTEAAVYALRRFWRLSKEAQSSVSIAR